MKPYSRMLVRASKASKATGWTSTEARVALAGIVVAALGVVAAAGSTIFTYQQVRMLSRERMTPYRAILYDAKVDSFRNIVVSFNKLARGAMPRYKVEIVDHPEPKFSPMRRMALTEVLGNASFINELSVWIEDIGAAEDALSLTPVWPEHIAKKMIHIKASLEPKMNCLQNMKSYPAIKRYASISDLTNQCKVANSNSWPLQDEMDQLIEDMRSDLRASQLQNIDVQE